MKLSLAAIEADSTECALEATPEELELTTPHGFSVRFEDPVKAHMRGRRVGEEFFLEGHVETRVVFTCVRCLAEFPAVQKAVLELVVHRVTTPQPSDDELDSYVEVLPGISEFDLGPHAREALLLAVPETPHCREDCKGLCAHCGADLNLESCTCRVAPPDSRWDALRTLSTAKR